MRTNNNVMSHVPPHKTTPRATILFCTACHLVGSAPTSDAAVEIMDEKEEGDDENKAKSGAIHILRFI